MDATYWTNEPRTSHLCKPLGHTLKDTSPLSMLEYFIQYMESVEALHLTQFWFSVESFKSASPAQLQPVVQVHSEKGALACKHSPLHTNLVSLLESQTDSNCSATSDSRCDSSSDMCTTACSVESKTTRVCSTDGKADVATDLDVRVNTVVGENQDQRSNSQQKCMTIVTDALGIYTTYIALNAHIPVGVPDEMRQMVEVSICPEDGVVDRACFNEAQAFVFETMEKRYYPEFLRSSILCKYQLEYITSGKLKLLDFLLGENALFYFLEYMEQETASALLQFWLIAESFRTHMSSPTRTPDIDTDTADAIAIYDRYFSLQASEPLNMGDAVRFDVENKICDEHGPRVDSFAMPQQIAYDIMNEVSTKHTSYPKEFNLHLACPVPLEPLLKLVWETYYPGFLESSIYLQFLNELLHMVKDSKQPNVVSELTSTGSDTDNNSDTPTPDIDVDDPDSLWRRPSFLMRLGHVDQFGQYVSEIDQAPQKPGKLKGRQRFSWMKSRRDDEELAMKIAKSIVTEVLSMYSDSSDTRHKHKISVGPKS